MTKITNHEGYAFFNGKPTHAKRVELKVTVVLDQVPGAFHSVEDHMKWIAQLGYVESVEIMEELARGADH